ncbi:iron donor protein CyaY [Amphibiibacter pelophylacis]|uniref:Iron donor protein CyaY n=1 Tax=Amphibiibacter pelophylacis TaxID=1799477 RepID=A0ACC6P0B3_9BURK
MAHSDSPAQRLTLNDLDYHQRTHAILAAVEKHLDRWLEEDVVDIDSQRNGGLLELKLPGGSAIILNTQPPLQELWLACRAGGYHFACMADAAHPQGQWRDTKTGALFTEVLAQALSDQAGMALTLDLPQ